MTTTDLTLLRRAVLLDPHDDTARLVFADALEESGGTMDAKWAALIRCGCELARLPEKPSKRNRHQEPDGSGLHRRFRHLLLDRMPRMPQRGSGQPHYQTGCIMSEPVKWPPRIVSEILSTMQQERQRLTAMASEKGVSTAEGQQCLRLAQVLEIGKEAMAGPNSHMDELLHERVTQLKEIEDRLNSIRLAARPLAQTICREIAALQDDVKKMIEVAEAEYAAF